MVRLVRMHVLDSGSADTAFRTIHPEGLCDAWVSYRHARSFNLRIRETIFATNSAIDRAEQNCHARSDPTGNLRQNDAIPVVVGHDVVNFDTSVDRSGMENRCPWAELVSPHCRQAVGRAIVGSNPVSGGSFHLNSKHHDRINIANNGINIVRDRD